MKLQREDINRIEAAYNTVSLETETVRGLLEKVGVPTNGYGITCFLVVKLGLHHNPNFQGAIS